MWLTEVPACWLTEVSLCLIYICPTIFALRKTIWASTKAAQTRNTVHKTILCKDSSQPPPHLHTHLFTTCDWLRNNVLSALLTYWTLHITLHISIKQSIYSLVNELYLMQNLKVTGVYHTTITLHIKYHTPHATHDILRITYDTFLETWRSGEKKTVTKLHNIHNT